jgi:hypothetical protein
VVVGIALPERHRVSGVTGVGLVKFTLFRMRSDRSDGSIELTLKIRVSHLHLGDLLHKETNSFRENKRENVTLEFQMLFIKLRIYRN